MNKLIDGFIKSISELQVPTILIGGLALSAYHVARTTLDIDSFIILIYNNIIIFT